MLGLWIGVCCVIFTMVRSADLSYTQPFEDRFLLQNDSMAMRWADFVIGGSKQLFTVSDTTGIIKDNKTVIDIGNRSIEVTPNENLECNSAVHLDKHVLSLCSRGFVWRASIADLDEKVEKLSVGQNLECYSIQTASPLKETAVMICQNADTSTNKSLVVVGVQPEPFQILYSWEIPQSGDDVILSSKDSVRLTMVHSHKLLNMTKDLFVIYNPDNRKVRFRAFSVSGPTSDKFTNLGYFEANRRISTQLDLKDDCMFINIQLGYPNLNMVFWCMSKNANLYLRCPADKLSEQSALSCPSELTLEESNQPKPQGMYLVQDKIGDLAFAIKYDGMLVLDFGARTLRKIFPLSDGFGDNPTVSYKTAAIFGEFGYVLQLQRDGPNPSRLLAQAEGQSSDSWSLWCYTFNLEKNYYVGQMLLSDIPKHEIDNNSTAAIFEEDLFGGSQPYIFVISSRYKKVFLFDTIEHTMVVDTKQSTSRVQADDFFNTSRVSVAVASGDSKLKVNFDMKIIDDISQVNIFNPPKQWSVYRGKSSYNFPIPGENFMGYGSSVSSAQSSLQPNIEYFNEVELDMPEVGDVSIIKSDQGGEILMISESNYTALACSTVASSPPKTPQAKIKCANLFSKDMREGQFIVGFVIAGTSTYILSQEKGQMTLELINNEGGAVKSKVTLPYGNRLAQIREFNNFIIFETIGYAQDDSLVLNYGFATLGENIDPNKMKTFNEFYKENITPVSLQKGSRKSNSIFIETTSQERFKILELGYNMQMEPTNNKEVELNKSIASAKTCYFTKYLFVADLTNQKVFAVSRGSNPPNLREYPFQAFGLDKVEELYCDYDNSQVVAKTKNAEDQLVLVVYRVEDGPLEALRRVHTICNMKSDDSFLVVTLGSIQDQDSSTVLTYNTQEGRFGAFNYQLYTPKITFTLPDQTTNKFEVEFSHNVEQSNVKKAQVEVTAMDQDRSISLGLYSKAPVDTSGVILLDDYLTVDGLGTTAELVTVADNLKGKVSLSSRVSSSPSLQAAKFSASFSKMIFSDSLVVAWKDDRLGIAELHKKESLEAPFEMTIKSLRECQIIENSDVVSCYARTNDLEASKVYLLRRAENSAGWVSVESSVNFMIRKVKTFQLQPGLFSYAMMDINNEIINVGTFAEERGALVAKGRFINHVQNKKMNAFDVLQIQNKLLVVKNDLGAKTVTFMEYGFDTRLNRISLMRTHNLPIFDSGMSEFSRPIQLKCHKNESEAHTDVFCFGAQEGVHSFIAQVKFPHVSDVFDKDKFAVSTAVSRVFTRKVFNVQGYIASRVKVVRNWAIVTAIRNEEYSKTVDEIKSKVILLVYKLNQMYSHPFAHVSLEELKLLPQEVHRIELSANVSSKANSKLMLTVFSLETADKYSVKQHNIGSFELAVPSDFKSQAKGQTTVLFSSPFSSTTVKKPLSELIFVDANSEDSKWFTWTKFLLTVCVVVVVFVVLIGCFHGFKRIQKLNKTDTTSTSEGAGSFLPAGDNSKTMGDDSYFKPTEKEGDTRI